MLLYPTDTVWGLGCDATSKKGVSRIFEIKQRHESKSLIILVDSYEMLSSYISKIPESVIDYLKNPSNPTTVLIKVVDMGTELRAEFYKDYPVTYGKR